MADYDNVRFHFFRDLSPALRLEILIGLGAVPPTVIRTLTHGIERIALDSLVRAGRLDELARVVDTAMANPCD